MSKYIIVRKTQSGTIEPLENQVPYKTKSSAVTSKKLLKFQFPEENLRVVRVSKNKFKKSKITLTEKTRGSKFRKAKGQVGKEFPNARIRTVQRGKEFDVKLNKKSPSVRVKLSGKDKLIAKLRALKRAFKN